MALPMYSMYRKYQKILAFTAALALPSALMVSPQPSLLPAARAAAWYDNDKTLLEQGKQQYNQGGFDQAIKLFTDSIKINPSRPDTYYWRGLALLAIKQNDRALADLSETIRLALFGLTMSSPVRAQEADQPNPQLESAISFVTAALPAGIDLDVAAVLPPPPLDGDADAAMLGPGMHMFKGELALTDDQYEKMYNLRNDFLDKFGPKMAEVSSLERHMRDVLTSPSIDAKKAAELKTKLAAAKSDLTEMKSDMQLQMAQVLTADQRKHLRLAMSKCPMMGRMCSGRMSRSKWSHHGGASMGSMGSWGRGPGSPECK